MNTICFTLENRYLNHDKKNSNVLMSFMALLQLFSAAAFKKHFHNQMVFTVQMKAPNKQVHVTDDATSRPAYTLVVQTGKCKCNI